MAKAAVFLAAMLLVATSARAETPRVVTSIKPLQSWAAGGMAGVTTPGVLSGFAEVPRPTSTPSETIRRLPA